jgi:hypothetical protein
MSVYTLYHTPCDAGFDPVRVPKAIDVLNGTVEPEAADDQADEWPDERWEPP